jgi:hypothetical protein
MPQTKPGSEDKQTTRYAPDTELWVTEEAEGLPWNEDDEPIPISPGESFFVSSSNGLNEREGYVLVMYRRQLVYVPRDKISTTPEG